MKIKIQTLRLTNFKGIKDLEVSFDDVNDVRGDNGTGKTTLFDAFTWLLFGKDSLDRKDFDIKTLDKDGKMIEKIDHEVDATLIVDSMMITLRRVYRQKWEKKRGTETAEYTGDKTEYYWNNVPLSQGDYQAKIGGLVHEGIFKAVSSTMYFNGTLPWQSRKTILVDMANVTTKDVLEKYPRFKELMSQIGDNKSLIEYQKEVSSTKLKIKKQLAEIPSRIDEIVRATPEARDFDNIVKTIAEHEAEIKRLEDSNAQTKKLMDAENVKYVEARRDALTASRRMAEIEGSYQSFAQEEADKANLIRTTARQQWNRLSMNLDHQNKELAELNANKEATELVLKHAREDYNKEDNKFFAFDSPQKSCPTCNREYPESFLSEKMDELVSAFEAKKEATLTRLIAQGKEEAEYLEKVKGQIITKSSEILAIVNQMQTAEKAMNKPAVEPQDIKDLLIADHEYQKLIPQAEFKPAEISQETLDFGSQIGLLRTTIATLQLQLAVKTVIDANNTRKAELLAQEKLLAKELAQLEKSEFGIEDYNRVRNEMVESVINDKFDLVKWKFSEEQNNGGTIETCEATVDGVPYSALNHSAKINVGMDCSNALSKHYDVFAPIWVDNSEAITQLIPTESQLITLTVAKGTPLTFTTRQLHTSMAEVA